MPCRPNKATMSDELQQHEPFFRAILDDWDNDAPRLVYADWLQERGDPESVARAEFIRAQCELSRLAPEDPQRTQVEQQAHEAYKAFRANRPLWNYELFERGFGQRVIFTAQAYLESADFWSRLGPIGAVGLLTGREESNLAPNDGVAAYRRLAKLPGLAFWRGVCCLSGTPLADDWFVALIDSPHMTGLRSLAIHNSVTEAKIRALAASPHLAQLESLSLAASASSVTTFSVWDPGLEALAQTRYLPRLRELDLFGLYFVQPRGLVALAASPLLAHVEELRLAGCLWDNRSVAALVASPHLGQLRELELGTLSYIGSVHITKQSIRTLAKWPQLRKLTHLRLDVQLAPDSLLQLFADQAPRLTSLVCLDLSNWTIPPNAPVSASMQSLLRERFGDRVCFDRPS